jgi:CheY-like chemotaxis protein
MAGILFIDDDPYTLETLTRAVELFNHQAILASSGEEALRLVAIEHPDLIFIDLMLPDIDGLQVLAQIREIGSAREIPIYLLSAANDRNIGEQARALGAQGYLTKPLRLQTLLDILQKYFA